MPFQPINYANIAPIGSPFLRDFVETLTSGYKAGQLPQKLEREKEKEQLANAMQKLLVEEQPQKFGEESQERQLKNAFQTLLNQEQPQKFGSEMSSEAVARALQQANINRIGTMTPLEAAELSLKNQLYPELTKSQIASNLALSKQRELGITGLGTGGKEEFYFQNLTAKSNPQLTPDQVFEASNAVREGKTNLPDGTTINVTPAMISSLDRLTKYGTTGSLITQAKTAEQAEKEVGVLGKYITKAVAPYGDTYAGYSPKQIMDTFSSNKEDQIKLGRLAAAQQLQTDLAAIQNKLNSGQSTASITNEILDRSEMMIKTRWPRMSGVARQEAMRYLTEALKEGLKARQEVRIGAAKIYSPEKNANSIKSRLKYNGMTGGFE